jgi:predicted nucleotidyltransferase
MTNDKIKILTDLKIALANRLNDNLVDVVLFGSQLSDNKTDSDYDILIIVKSKTNWRLEREISDVCFDIDLKYGILTDTHILSRDDLNSPRGRQPIFKNAIKQGFHA